MEYDDFHLWIGRSGEDFLAVVRDEDHEMASEPFVAPFSPEELEHRMARLESTLRDAYRVKEDPSEVARNLGEELFRAVFSGAVFGLWVSRFREVRRQGRGLRLRLYLDDPESIGWPWELLRDKAGNWLAVSRDTPLIRSLKGAPPLRPVFPSPSIRVLVMIAHPMGCERLDSDREWKELKEALQHKRFDVGRLPGGDLGSLCEGLKEPVHILHFIGHGTGARIETPGVLALEGPWGERDPTTGNDLATVLRDHESLGLVVLNACEGARIRGSDAFSGVAQSLIRAGIPTVVAMQLPVTDHAAIEFTRHLYRNLAEGRPVDEAVTNARKFLFSGRFHREWATPVLYMRSRDGDVIPPPAKGIGRSSMIRLVASAVAMLLTGLLYLSEIGNFHPKASSQLSSKTPPAKTGNTRGCPRSKALGASFVRIPAGRFTMGTKPRDKEERAHEVEITRPFCIGPAEVTVGQWRAVMGDSYPGLDEHLPVSNVSWDEVQEFLRRLNEQEPGAEYRLPTEAQWEYAARARSRADYSFGEDPDDLHLYGNCQNRSVNDLFNGLAPVGSYRPNDWGLYDMHGNVSEWVADWYEPYRSERQVDPRGPDRGELKVRRGGSFEISPDRCDATLRNHSKPDYKSDDVGFRIVRNPLP